MRTPISFVNGRGLTLRGFIFEPQKFKNAVIFLHGFPSSCQGKTAPRLAEALEKKGYLVLIFDFSHSSASDGKFEEKLMSREVEDIRYAVNFLEDNYPYEHLTLVGHSTGAIDAALYAHQDKRIDRLVLMGGVSDLKHAVRYDFTDEQVHNFWKRGYILLKSKEPAWWEGKKLKKAFYDEFFTLDIPSALKRWKKPLLIVHGEKDEAVPLREAEELLAQVNSPKRLVIIREADHRFSQERHFQKVIKVLHRFCKK